MPTLSNKAALFQAACLLKRPGIVYRLGLRPANKESKLAGRGNVYSQTMCVQLTATQHVGLLARYL